MIKNKKKFELDWNNLLKQALLSLTIIGVLIAIYFSFLYISEPKFVNLILMLPFIFFLTPYLILKLYELKIVEIKMRIIPRFLRDIVNNIESGMDLISSIKSTGNNEYSSLNGDVKKLINQLSWGIDFNEALSLFADNVGSVNLKRDFLLVIEARKVGGHVGKILRELSIKINQDNLINSERKSNLASTTFTGYISFLIFIFIIIIVYNNLFLGIASNINGGVTNIQGDDDTKMNTFLTLLIFLAYELAILSGFLFGLMQENNILAGAPHVVLLVLFTFIGFFFFI